MRSEDKEVLITTSKCLVNLYINLLDNSEKMNEEEFNKEFNNLRTAAIELLAEARKNDVVFDKEDRFMLYDLIKD